MSQIPGSTQIDFPAGVPANVPSAQVQSLGNPDGKKQPAAPQDGKAPEKPTEPPMLMFFQKPQQPFPMMIRDLSPDQLSAYLQAFELGLWMYTILIWEQMRKRDGHLLSVSQKRFKAVAKLEWEIQPNDDSPEASAHAEFLADFIGDIPQFSRSVRHLMTAHANKVAGCEIFWKPGAGSDGSIRCELIDIDTHYFDKTGGVLHVALGGGFSGQTSPIIPDKFIIHETDVALMIASSILFLIKVAAAGDWSSFVDKFGMPGLIGTAPDGASQESKTTLWNLLQNWATELAALLPPGYTVQTVETKGTGTPHHDLIQWCEEGLSKIWLGQTLTTDAKSGTGTLAGSAHQTEQQDMAQDDAMELGQVFDRFLCEPAVRFQFGQPLMATFKFKIAKTVDLAAAINVDQIFINSLGQPVARSDLYAKYGWRMPEENEDVVKPNPAAKTQPVTAPAKEQSGTDGTALKAGHRGGAGDANGLAELVAGIADPKLEAGRAAIQRLVKPLQDLIDSAPGTMTHGELEKRITELDLPRDAFGKVVEGILREALTAGDQRTVTEMQAAQREGQG